MPATHHSLSHRYDVCRIFSRTLISGVQNVNGRELSVCCLIREYLTAILLATPFGPPPH